MRLVIVTGCHAHHKRLCAHLVARFNVVGIIHPAENRRPVTSRIGRWVREARLSGWTMVGFDLVGKILTRSAKSRRLIHRSSVPPTDSVVKLAYDEIPQSLIHPDFDVKTKECCGFLRSLLPDVTVCLGGPVYPKAFIDSSPLMLNFHSGISPVYNGTASIQFAFANGHPHLCGGTLMVMSPEVDGGRILGHYLPRVQSGDSPESLFEKTVFGIPLMYEQVLQHLAASRGELHSIPQPPPLFYTRGAEFGWYQRERIKRNLRVDLAARFARNERAVKYWSESTAEAARCKYEAFLRQLLWGSGAIGNEPEK